MQGSVHQPTFTSQICYLRVGRYQRHMEVQLYYINKCKQLSIYLVHSYSNS